MHGDNKTISLLVEKGAKRKWYVMYGLWIYREIKLKNRCAKKPFNKPEPNDLVNKIVRYFFFFFVLCLIAISNRCLASLW